MNPGIFEGLWHLHEAEPPMLHISKSTLYSAWTDHWHSFMPFRNTGQGERCRECAAFDQEMMNCTTTVERQAVFANKLKHLDEIAADRRVDVRGNTVS